MNRREILVTAGVLTAGGFAGCQASTDTDYTTPTTTEEPTRYEMCRDASLGVCGIETPPGARDGDPGSPVQVITSGLHRDGSTVRVTGTAENTLGNPLSCVGLVVCFFTNQDELLGTTTETFSEVGGTEQWQFSIQYTGDRPDDVAGWKIETRSK
jgi:hypothetical protein